MSLASCSYQTTYVKGNESFTVSLIGNDGDPFQSYQGSPSSPTAGSLIPDWSGTNAKPLLRTVLMDSDPTVQKADLRGMISDANTKWLVDDVELVFDNNDLSLANTTLGIAAGLFKKINVKPDPGNASAPFGGLEIQDNLVAAFSGRSITVQVQLALIIDSKPVTLAANSVIKFSKRGEGDNLAHIYCASTESMVLDDPSASVTLLVNCWKAGAQLASTAFTRKWFILENGAWAQKGSADTLTLTADDIPTFADVKCECWSKDATPVLIASDIQTVCDQNDPLHVIPNPTPADGKIRQGDGNAGVSFDPVLVDDEGNQPYATNTLRYLFTVLNSSGMVLNSSSNAFGMAASTTQFAQSPSTKFSVPRTVFEAEGEGPLVNITCIQI